MPNLPVSATSGMKFNQSCSSSRQSGRRCAAVVGRCRVAKGRDRLRPLKVGDALRSRHHHFQHHQTRAIASPQLKSSLSAYNQNPNPVGTYITGSRRNPARHLEALINRDYIFIMSTFLSNILTGFGTPKKGSEEPVAAEAAEPAPPASPTPLASQHPNRVQKPASKKSSSALNKKVKRLPEKYVAKKVRLFPYHGTFFALAHWPLTSRGFLLS